MQVSSSPWLFGRGRPPVNGARGQETAPSAAQGDDYIEVARGLNGLIYGLTTSVKVFNPDTLAFVQSISLKGGPDSDIRDIAVDSSGNIYAVTFVTFDHYIGAHPQLVTNPAALTRSARVNR